MLCCAGVEKWGLLSRAKVFAADPMPSPLILWSRPRSQMWDVRRVRKMNLLIRRTLFVCLWLLIHKTLQLGAINEIMGYVFSLCFLCFLGTGKMGMAHRRWMIWPGGTVIFCCCCKGYVTESIPARNRTFSRPKAIKLNVFLRLQWFVNIRKRLHWAVHKEKSIQ